MLNYFPVFGITKGAVLSEAGLPLCAPVDPVIKVNNHLFDIESGHLRKLK